MYILVVKDENIYINETIINFIDSRYCYDKFDFAIECINADYHNKEEFNTYLQVLFHKIEDKVGYSLNKYIDDRENIVSLFLPNKQFNEIYPIVSLTQSITTPSLEVYFYDFTHEDEIKEDKYTILLTTNNIYKEYKLINIITIKNVDANNLYNILPKVVSDISLECGFNLNKYCIDNDCNEYMFEINNEQKDILNNVLLNKEFMYLD